MVGKLRKVVAVALLICLGACATAPKKDVTIFDQLGGDKGVARIVNQLLLEIAADDRIHKYFVDINIAGFRGRLESHFCRISDGPCEYEGRSMREAHRLLGIDHAAFNALVEDLIDAMETLKIDYAVQNAFLARLAPLQADITTS